MPQKVFKRLHPHLSVEPEAIFSCLEALRPYHGMLLLYDERELLDQVKLIECFHVLPSSSFNLFLSHSGVYFY